MIIDPAKQSFKDNHKLMIGSIVPRPIAFVSTKSTDGILNLAPFKRINKTLIAHTDLLVFNELEFSLFSNLDTSHTLKLDNLKEKIENLNLSNKLSLIVTLGERGLVFYKNNKLEYIEAEKVQVVDTVGSGDCFIGALSYSLLKNKSLKESCEFANKSAAISVTKKGAAISMPRLEEVRSFYSL